MLSVKLNPQSVSFTFVMLNSEMDIDWLAPRENLADSISLLGVLPLKVPPNALIDVNVISTSPCTEDGLVVSIPDAMSFTVTIFHLPSKDEVTLLEPDLLQHNKSKL